MPAKKDQVDAQINSLLTCETSAECLEIAERLGALLSEDGLSVEVENVLLQLMTAANNKKSGLEREGGLIGVAGIAKVMGAVSVPLLLEVIPNILDLEADKGLPVREAARLALNNILKNVNSHGMKPALLYVLEGTNAKWQTKLATLEILENLASNEPDAIGDCLPDIIPAVTNCMHETKFEVFVINKG
jgi:elongation factor 3